MAGLDRSLQGPGCARVRNREKRGREGGRGPIQETYIDDGTNDSLDLTNVTLGSCSVRAGCDYLCGCVCAGVGIAS